MAGSGKNNFSQPHQFFGFDGVDDDVIRREKGKARDLRKSRWWQQKISKGTCYYCGAQIKPRELTMDHVVPLARGGRSTKDNLVACCKECNTRKKTMLPLEWDEYMSQLKKEE
jgi:5-methylcytosine-specific restriction endonuclease McrA